LSRLAARGWPVLYSSGPLTYWDRGSDEWAQAGLLSHVDQHDGVCVDRPGRLSAAWPKFTTWHNWSLRRHGRRLLRINRAKLTDKNILFLFHPLFYPYVDQTTDACVVYHAFDTFSMLPGWRDEYARHEEALVERADIVLATSPAIRRNLPGSGPEKSIEFNNGVDFELFSGAGSTAVPEDLARITGPRVGFVGRITPKVDFALVADIAAQKPEWNWVFVGPIVVPADGQDEMQIIAYEGLTRCQSMKNIHFLGTKHHTELPSYMANMDVNTIPNRVGGGWWQAAYPLKLHEYLATGRPVVGSELEVFENFRSVMQIAQSMDDWISALDTAISGNGVGNPESRVATARDNSWESRVDDLELILEEKAALNA